MLTTSQIASLSDSKLEALFVVEYDAKRRSSPYYNALVSEIIGRIAGVSSFISGIFGSTRFPEYERRTVAATGFAQSDAARGAVSDSASALLKKAKDAAATGAMLALVGLVAAGFLVYQLKKK